MFFVYLKGQNCTGKVGIKCLTFCFHSATNNRAIIDRSIDGNKNLFDIIGYLSIQFLDSPCSCHLNETRYLRNRDQPCTDKHGNVVRSNFEDLNRSAVCQTTQQKRVAAVA